MDEKYIKDLWDWTTSQDPTFTDRYTFESWKEKLGTDNEYQEKFHSWVSSQDKTFAQRRPLEQWKELVKKKGQTTQPSVQGGSTDLSSEDGSLVSAESLKKQQKDREDREAMLAKINAPMSEEEYTTRLGETLERGSDEGIKRMREEAPKSDATQFEVDPETGLPDFSKQKIVGRDIREKTYREPELAGGLYPTQEQMDKFQRQKLTDQFTTYENIEEELPALQAKQNAEAAAKSEIKDIEEQVRLGNIEDEGFQFALSTIEPQLIDKNPKVVIDKLRKQFDGYGFVFQDANVGNLMVVAAPNGNTTLVHLDPWLSSTEIAESKKLRDFMLVNSTHKPADAPTGLVINSMRAKQLRDVARDNGDGSESTVLFTSFDEDGKYKVIPTLFPKDPETYTAKPADWMELSFKEAREVAEKRGEVFVFDTQEEAEDFAQGNWKDVSTHEAEALDFYRKRGMDYDSEKQVYDKYMDATDIMFFLDPDRDGSANLIGKDRVPFREEDLSEEQVEMLGNKVDKYYINGKLREDTQEMLKDAEKVADRLSLTFLAEESQLAREEFDLYLNKRHQAEIPKAIEMNFRVKEIEDKIVEDALENFDLRPEELVGIDFEDPIKNEKARKISQAFEETQVYKSIAADKYYNANTYYDMKHNKAATKEYVDNWDSFTTEWSGGLSRGRAGDVILAGAFYPEILGGFDLNDPESTQKMAEKLVMHLQDEPEKISRVMSRYSQARTSSEIANVIFSDPLEWATSLAAGSLSQMLPYGKKIVSASVATGAGTGAIYGSVVPGAGTVSGAITGGIWGFRTGMAATSLAMEYTNEMIESIREFCEENGSTINDAEMVAVALQTQSVWDKGRERGLKRGIPIAMVDMLTSSLAGRILAPSKLASKGSRIAANTAERLALDPFFEGVGEYAAQVTVGDDIDWKEIYAEAGGAVGNNTSNMSINLLRQAKRTNNIEKASELTRINDIVNESASDSRISEWANNMERLGQISPEENKRIQDNVGLRKTANELLSTGRIERRLQGKKDKALTERVMQLLAAKEELSSTTNRKELFGKKIGEINDELNDIITTKKLKPKDKQTMLEGTGVLFSGEQASTADIRGAMPTYKLKTNKFKRARQVTKQEMLNYIESSTPEKLNNTPLIKVSNDSDVNNALVKKMMQGKLEDKLAETQAEVADAESISVVEGEVDVDATETVAEEVVSSKTLGETEATQQVTEDVAEEVAPEVTEDVAEEVAPTTEEAVDAVLFEQEAKDLEAKLKEEESGKGPKVDFRLKTVEETDQEFGPSAEETQDITRQINEQESPNISTEITSGVTQKIDVDELNTRTDRPLKVTTMEVIKGIPTIFTISDQLTTGSVVNPETGNTIDNLRGGLGFTGTVGNEQAAWANTTDKEAVDLYVKAEKVYNDNKEVFESWWKANPEHKGLVPMNVVKMGEGSILSNEATFRVLADNLTKIPAKNKKNALKLLRKNLNNKITNLTEVINEGEKKKSTLDQYKKTVENSKKTLELIKDATSIEDVIAIEKIKELTLPARRELIELIAYSQPNRHNETKGVSAPGSDVSKALIEGMGADARRLINLGVITDLITDNQMAKVPQRSIVAIQGVDVLNGGPMKTIHPNYDYGLKGRTIGILEESVAIQDAYGTAYNAALKGLVKADAKPKKVTEKQAEENQAAFDKGTQKQKEGKKLTKAEAEALEVGRLEEGQEKAASMKTVLTETIGVQNGLPGLEFIGAVSEGNIDNVNKLINFMNSSFPSVNISTDSQTFATVIESEGVKKYLKGDEIIYGVTVDGDVYINPDVHNSKSSIYNTAIHEMGHVWTDYLKATKKGKEIYKKGSEIIQKTDEFKKQLKAFDGDVVKATDETMAILIGNKGQTITDAALKSKFKEWLLGMWNYIKSQFKMSKDLTAEEIQNLNLDKFLGTALADIFSGKEIKLTDNQLKKLKNPDAAFRQGMSIDNIVRTGRANGFSDASIKVVLKDRGFKADAINESMTVQIDLVTEMPSEFGNVEGGAIVGQKLFNEVRDAVNAFAIEGPRGGVGTAGVRTKTFAEVRQKAIEIMKANPIFEVQDEQIQMELLNAFDRALGIRSNPRVRQQIADIRAKLKQRKKGAKNLKDAQRAMRMRIRQLLPSSKNYSNTTINKLIKVINETTDKNFNGQMTKVLNEVEKQRTVLRNKVILKIQDLVAKKAKTARTQSGKKRSAGLDAIGQSYFAEVKKVLRAAIKQDADAMLELQNSVDENLYNEGMQAIDEGNKPTRKQQQMVDRQLALDTFSDVLTMNLEEVNALFEEVKKTRGESIARLNNNREARKIMAQEIKDALNNQMKEDFKEMYDDNGNPLNKNQLNKRREKVRLAFKNNGVFSALTEWGKQFLTEGRKYKVNSLTKFFYNNIAHLGTITNILDRGKKGMFTKVFYDNLNNMDENNLKGVRRVTDKMNAITQSIVGKTWMDWKYSLGSDIIEIEGAINTKTGEVYKEAMNKDQAMRVIALSLNDDQKGKLIEQGFTEAVLKDLKTFVGEDQVKIIEQTVDFLSNKYFEETNAVYSQVNDVNLGFVENYFPTRTLSQSEVTASMIGDADIQKIFTAEFSPALKERTDRTSDVELGLSFTDVMEEHTKQMEKYKAYALGVKEIDNVLKDEGVKNILRETGTEKVFKIALNYAINPDAGPSVDPTIIDKLQRKYTGFALAFKLIQIPKQATSFVQAYDSYAGGKTKVPGYKLLSFMFDYAKVLVMLRSEIKEAREISATFDNRIKQGLEGDVFGLESGTRTFKKGTAQQGKRGKLKRGFRKAGGLPTVAGDILGVLGYKAVYNKAIRDGKSKAEALRMFNDYNATQQSRRATEKNQLQQSNDWKARFFTMFGSTVFLQQNKVYQSLNNLLKLKKPSSKDVKTFALNYAVANVLFTMAAYSASLISGNSDDRDRAYKAMLDAAKGKNLLFQIPMLGAALEGMNNKITGDRKPISEGVNPFMILPSKVMKAYDGLNPESIVKTATPFLEIMLGAQLDAPVALAKLMGGDASEENVLTTLGVSKSYRPGYGQKESKTTKKKEQTEAQMKKALKLNNEETYNKRYGPGTQSYKREQKMKERKKEMRERTRARRR